jgi:hypothetical protein
MMEDSLVSVFCTSTHFVAELNNAMLLQALLGQDCNHQRVRSQADQPTCPYDRTANGSSVVFTDGNTDLILANVCADSRTLKRSNSAPVHGRLTRLRPQLDHVRRRTG